MNFFIGLDIGGTKIAAAIAAPNGRIIGRTKTSTPKNVRPQDIYLCVMDSIDELIKGYGVKRSQIKGIGLGVPGIVDSYDRILAAPNINLTGFPLSVRLKRKFRVPVAMSNDVNAGLLGEAWLGAAKGLNNVAGIFPGTGIGGAVVLQGQIFLGEQGAAAEFGHMIMDVNGPLCHCGNNGCLESLASRWAIERDIRVLIKSGRKSVITTMTGGNLSAIKSRVLKGALAENDAVVKMVLSKASGYLAKAAVSINHIFNPQAIVFGGGVIKACGHFMVPIINKTVQMDPFFKKFNICRVLQSKLEDDAVLLGAIRLAQGKTKQNNGIP